MRHGIPWTGVSYCRFTPRAFFIGIQQYVINRKERGLRLNTSALTVHEHVSLILMQKYEVTEFLRLGFLTVGSHKSFVYWYPESLNFEMFLFKRFFAKDSSTPYFRPTTFRYSVDVSTQFANFILKYW